MRLTLPAFAAALLVLGVALVAAEAPQDPAPVAIAEPTAAVVPVRLASAPAEAPRPLRRRVARADTDTVAVPTPVPVPVEEILEGAPPDTVAVPPAEPAPEPRARVIGTGVASYYGGRFHGRRTASGERFNQNALTAAHRTLPFGTRVRVVHVRSGRSVVVRINDRGPVSRRRIIDLSKGAARRLGMVRSGTARVRLERLS